MGGGGAIIGQSTVGLGGKLTNLGVKDVTVGNSPQLNYG
jgi:hypothetical protein